MGVLKAESRIKDRWWENGLGHLQIEGDCIGCNKPEQGKMYVKSTSKTESQQEGRHGPQVVM